MMPRRLCQKICVLASLVVVCASMRPDALQPGMHMRGSEQGRAAIRRPLFAFAGAGVSAVVAPRLRPSTSCLRMCLSAQEAVNDSPLEGDKPATTGSSLGFNTYGDVFRMALSDVEVDAVHVVDVPVDQAPRQEAQPERKKKGVVSALGSSVVSVLNNIFAGPSADEVQKNLEAFAASHPGIGLAIEPSKTKRLVDLERLEKCFERELGERNLDLDDPN